MTSIHAYSLQCKFFVLTFFQRISDVKWKDKNIVIMDEVTIYPPYKLDDVKGKPKPALDHITKIVSTYCDSVDM